MPKPSFEWPWSRANGGIVERKLAPSHRDGPQLPCKVSGMPRLIQALPNGALDLIGDVHGELEALLRLLHRLGVDVERARAPRHLVFVGDLIDRGPDSVGVVEVVERLMQAGVASVVAGNHELNLLAGERKEGNGWFWGDANDHAQFDLRQAAFPSRLADTREQAKIRALFSELPLVLMRDDLRVVHASWDPEAAAKLPEDGDIAKLAAFWEERLEGELQASGLRDRAADERAAFAGLTDERIPPTRHLAAVAAEDAAYQRLNPIKLLTSGAEVEVAPGGHFFVGGKWRFVTRDRWWKRPVDRPTVIGHYWRRREHLTEGRPDVWDDVPPFAWAGDVYCVDYSVGRRFLERFRGRTEKFHGGLGALRWPEREVVFDDRDGSIPTGE